jgi:nucleotide-binding universal stress UspA family protein
MNPEPDMMNPLETVLLAVDFGPTTDSLVARALWLAGQHRPRLLTLAHVIDARILDGLVGVGDARAELEADAQAAVEEALGDLAERFRAAGAAEVESDCRSGRPDAELAELIASRAPDLVLVGGGHRTWSEVVLGSTARRLLRSVQRPLWLGRSEQAPDVRRLLLACDFSPSSVAAARFAAQLWPQAEFELLHVVQHLTDIVVGLNAGGMATPGLPAELLERCQRRLDAFAAEHLGGLQVSTRLEQGHPLTGLLRRLHDRPPDLLVLGRSGRHGVDAALLGSVAEALVERVGCDMLLVPAGRA